MSEFLTASVNRGPCNTYACVVPDFSPKSLENAYTGGQNAKRIFALSFNLQNNGMPFSVFLSYLSTYSTLSQLALGLSSVYGQWFRMNTMIFTKKITRTLTTIQSLVFDIWSQKSSFLSVGKIWSRFFSIWGFISSTWIPGTSSGSSWTVERDETVDKKVFFPVQVLQNVSFTKPSVCNLEKLQLIFLKEKLNFQHKM